MLKQLVKYSFAISCQKFLTQTCWVQLVFTQPQLLQLHVSSCKFEAHPLLFSMNNQKNIAAIARSVQFWNVSRGIIIVISYCHCMRRRHSLDRPIKRSLHGRGSSYYSGSQNAAIWSVMPTTSSYGAHGATSVSCDGGAGAVAVCDGGALHCQYTTFSNQIFLQFPREHGN